ncbi:hypothetical protein B7P43_G10789 [Cryptotermes secundus]|uniref:LRRCT domain-containing protein n=2 Tax=Cryptotermes secundus TaxID=105785 RepID=A0A2J7QKR6_9NEOP|nr:hypothetical protein B7P43_G10789 [Cryptotermes secundus]
MDLHAFSGLTELIILDLSYNHLDYILPATFEDTPRLRSFYLQGNRLKIYPGPFLIIPALQILDISSCQLDHLYHDNFMELPALLSLNLSHNQLIKLEVNVLATLQNLQSIDLRKNPWSCDGNTHELEAWLKKYHVQFDPVCKKKPENSDKFQKIVSAVDNQNDTEVMSDDDLLRLWSINAKDKDSYMKENECVKSNNSTSNSDNIFKIFDKIPSFWSFLMGIEIGIVIGGIGMWLLNRFHRVRTSQPMPVSRRLNNTHSIQSLQNRASFFRWRSIEEDTTALWTELETINCPDTPPPAYRDSFVHIQRNTFT